MKSETWSKIGAGVGLVGFLLTLLTPIIDSKAAPYEEEQTYKKFEERYGLTPIEKKED